MNAVAPGCAIRGAARASCRSSRRSTSSGRSCPVVDRDPVRVQRRPLAHDLAGLLAALVLRRPERSASATTRTLQGALKHTLLLAVICVAVAVPLGVDARARPAALARTRQRHRQRAHAAAAGDARDRHGRRAAAAVPADLHQIGLGTHGAGDRPDHVHDLVRGRHRARPAGLDRAGVRGGRGRPRRAAARRAAAACCCRCSRPRSWPAPRSSSRSRSTTSSSPSTSPATPSTTTVSMLLYSSARGAPTPALNALATIALFITLGDARPRVLRLSALRRRRRRAPPRSRPWRCERMQEARSGSSSSSSASATSSRWTASTSTCRPASSSRWSARRAAARRRRCA